MEYVINEESDVGVLSCTLKGELDVQESIELSQRLREKAAAKKFNIFYDARDLREPINIVPVFNYTKELSTILQIPRHRNVKVAFLYEPGEYDEQWKFYEEAALKRGLQIKVFVEKTVAMEWLASCPDKQ